MPDVPGRRAGAARRGGARDLGADRRAASVFLDARPALGERFAERFPTVSALCRKPGIDPAREPIPVRPAAHYHMGGVADGWRAAAAPSRACGPAARWPPPGCTAPTAWPATRFSRRWRCRVGGRGSARGTSRSRSRALRPSDGIAATLSAIGMPSTAHWCIGKSDGPRCRRCPRCRGPRAARSALHGMMADEAGTPERRDAALVTS